MYLFSNSVICEMFVFKMKHTPYGVTIANRIAYIVSNCLDFDTLCSKIMCVLVVFFNIMNQNITLTLLFALSVTLVNLLL